MSLHAVACELSERQHGVVSTYQLRERGASEAEIRHLVDSDQWSRVSLPVLRRVGSPATREQRASAAVLDAGPVAALSCHTGGAWFSLRSFQLFPLHVTRHRDLTGMPARLSIIHEPRLLPDHHVTTLRGVRVTVPSRIPFDIAALGDVRGAARALDRAWTKHLLNHASITKMLDELAGKGRKGITLMRELIGERGPNYRPNDTGLEDRFQELASAVGFRFERQRNLCDMGEWLARVDFLDERRKLVAEIDSAEHHEAMIDEVADAVRQKALEGAGYRVERFTDHEIFYEREATLDRLWALRRSGG